jgi:hypothetical protein
VTKVELYEYSIVTEDTVIRCTTGPVEVEKNDFKEAGFHGSYGMQIA